MKPILEDYIGEVLRFPDREGYHITIGRRMLIEASGHFNHKPDKKTLKHMIRLLKSNLDAGMVEAIRNSKTGSKPVSKDEK